MNPFLEVPTGTDPEDKTITARIKPGQIEYYEPGNSGIGTTIVMQSGNRIFTTLSYREVDDALTSYVKCLKDNPGKFSTLAVTTPKPSDVIKMPLKPELLKS